MSNTRLALAALLLVLGFGLFGASDCGCGKQPPPPPAAPTP